MQCCQEEVCGGQLLMNGIAVAVERPRQCTPATQNGKKRLTLTSWNSHDIENYRRHHRCCGIDIRWRIIRQSHYCRQ